MKIQNADSRDYDNFYEVHIICRTEKELDKATTNLEKEEDFELNAEFWDDCYEVISVAVDPSLYDTKQEFLKDVRKTAKQ